jgi:hypothetical protein
MRTVQPHLPSTSSFPAPRRKRASSGWPGGKVANILNALRPTSAIPATGSVLNPTLARLERDFMRAIHNAQESGGGLKRKLLTRNGGRVRKHRKSLPVVVRGVPTIPCVSVRCRRSRSSSCRPAASGRRRRADRVRRGPCGAQRDLRRDRPAAALGPADARRHQDRVRSRRQDGHDWSGGQ